MRMYREPDTLATLLLRERARVLECLTRFAEGRGAAAISEARDIVRALADAETHVLYPAFSRVSLRPETQRLLDDSRDARAEQLAALDVLAHKRAARLRKLGAVALSDAIEHHARQHVSLLVPVLASQLPRPVYRSLVNAFAARVADYDARPARTTRSTVSAATSTRGLCSTSDARIATRSLADGASNGR